MKQTQYRDTKIGRFVSKSTWKRSKAQGGTRYKRQSIEHKPKRIQADFFPRPLPEIDTWIITFDYKGKSRTFNGEMRIQIYRSIYPDIGEEGVMDLVQAALEGEKVDGIKVETFEVRGEDKTATITEYDFASSFIRSAQRVSEETITHEPKKRKRTRKKGKKTH